MTVIVPSDGRRTAASSLVPTVGVEEEFLLVDRRTLRPVTRAPQVIADLAPALGGQVQAEFLASQVELCTRPVLAGADLAGELARLRTVAARVAHQSRCLLVASGTPVLPGPVEITDNARYRSMAQRFAPIVAAGGGGVCGCHVHIGTASRAEALALSNQLRPWLPVVQALAANSPFQEGRDAGFASSRAVRWGRWPTVGPAPLLDEAGYERLADTLVDSGPLLDRKMIYWYARPSEHVPTLEIRVADVNAELDTTVLVATLVRGLALALVDAVRDGCPPPPVPDRLLRAAHWEAARHGLEGAGLDPLSGRRRPMWALVDHLFERAAPGLAQAGDLVAVPRLLDRLWRDGSGAARQRAAYARRGQLGDVVRYLAGATASG